MDRKGKSKCLVAASFCLLAAVITLAGCGGGGGRLDARSSCRDFMDASSEDQDRAVSRLAVEFRAPDAVTPLGRPNVDYLCAANPDRTLGDAVRATGGQQPTQGSNASGADDQSSTGATATTEPNGLSDLFNGIRGSDSGPSVGAELKRTQQNPKDAARGARLRLRTT